MNNPTTPSPEVPRKITIDDIDTLDWDKYPDGLIPAIIQDAESGNIRMLGFMNREALCETFKRGLVVFYSRSQGKIWPKGMTSGNTLDLQDISTDCDRDTLLVQALPNGPTCHTLTTSCFSDAIEWSFETMPKTARTIADTLGDTSDTSDSYEPSILETAQLLVKSTETNTPEELTQGTARLLYEILGFMAEKNIAYADVMKALSEQRDNTIN